MMGIEAVFGAANLAIAIGPALGTLLFLGFGAGEAFAFDAATFALSALLLRQVHPRERGAPSVSHSILRSLREGWGEVRSRAWV